MALAGRRRAAELSAARARAEQAERDRAACRHEVEVLRAALGAVPVGVVITAADGSEVLRNGTALIGGHGEVLLADAIDRLAAAARGGTPGDETVTLFGPPRRVLHVRAEPLAGGAAVVSVDDVSERARLDSVRTDFVTNISHELKTPVGALAVLAETISDSADDDVARRLAVRMVDEAHRASRTIDDLLELSRIELDGRDATEPVQVEHVVEEAAARHRFHAEQEGVELSVASVQRATVMGDRLQLVSAVSNLIDNAVKYTNTGGSVRIAVFVEGSEVLVRVVDTGVGIPANDLDRVFERFYRVDRARSRRTGGTGLGLAIVRHVAANHGGTVRVTSQEGVGSTFELVLPLVDER